MAKKKRPDPPKRNYYGFSAVNPVKGNVYYSFEEMTTNVKNDYKVLTLPNMRSAMKARSAAHALGSRKGWKFRTHLKNMDGGSVVLNVWRVA